MGTGLSGVNLLSSARTTRRTVPSIWPTSAFTAACTAFTRASSISPARGPPPFPGFITALNAAGESHGVFENLPQSAANVCVLDTCRHKHVRSLARPALSYSSVKMSFLRTPRLGSRILPAGAARAARNTPTSPLILAARSVSKKLGNLVASTIEDLSMLPPGLGVLFAMNVLSSFKYFSFALAMPLLATDRVRPLRHERGHDVPACGPAAHHLHAAGLAARRPPRRAQLRVPRERARRRRARARRARRRRRSSCSPCSGSRRSPTACSSPSSRSA